MGEVNHPLAIRGHRDRGHRGVQGIALETGQEMLKVQLFELVVQFQFGGQVLP
jgi:hypothetical protein